MRPTGRLVAVALLGLCVVGCAGGTDAEPQAKPSPPELAAEIIQLRRDQVLERIEVALQNTGPTDVVVESLHVHVPGFRSGGPVPKDSPVRSTQVVNLPWPYGTVRCGDTEAPAVGRPVVTVRVHTALDPASRRVRLVAGDTSGLLQRIADRACTIQRLRREVDLRFADDWRAEQTSRGVVLHGTVLARLLTDEPRTVSQVAGAIMYGLQPDESAGPVRDPLAVLTPAQPEASIPVEAYAARCDPHTIGEIKKPYEFLVWISSPGEEAFAITPAVGQGTKDALRKACAF